MTTKTGMLCMKCKDVLNNEDDIFGTSCGHLYHFLCLRGCHSESQKCSHCETHKPCIFKMSLEFGNVITSWKDQAKTIKLQSELEKNNNDFAFLKEKYRASKVLLLELEDKLQKLNDGLNSKNGTISYLEDRIETLQVLNNFLIKDNELLVKNFRCESKIKLMEKPNSSHFKTQTSNKEISNETTKEKPNILGMFKEIGYFSGYNKVDKDQNVSNCKKSNIFAENGSFDWRKIRNSTENLKENQEKGAENKTGNSNLNSKEISISTENLKQTQKNKDENKTEKGNIDSREMSNSTENLKETQNNNAENKTVENSHNTQENISEFNKIVVICNYPRKYLNTFTPEECVIFVARKMAIKLSVEDITKILVLKIDLRHCSLLVYFKDILYKQQFLSNKKQLKKFRQTSNLQIKE